MQRWSTREAALGVVLGAWLVPAAGMAAPAKSGEELLGEGDARSRVPNLVILVETGVPEGERIGGWIEERAAEVLREHEPPLASEELIRVLVGGGPYDYQIQITLLQGDRPLEEQPDVLVCECGSDEMLDRVGEAIDAGARRLTDAAKAAREEAAKEVVVVAPRPTASKVQPVDTRKRRPGIGYAGIGVGVLGVGLLAVGIPLAVQEDEFFGSPGNASTYSTRGPGIGLAIGGGVALAMGITLIVVDVVRSRRPKVTVVPSVGTRQAGLSLMWKV